MIRIVFALLAGGLLKLAHAAEAAPVASPTTSAFSRDLGQGLMYFRVPTLPGGLPSAEGRPAPPTVLDLRFAQGDTAGASALIAWLEFRATAKSPVLVLVNAETDQPLLRALAQRRPTGSIVTIGATSATYAPDLAIETTIDQERRAYDALKDGVAATALVTENSDKARNDEASLAHERPAESTAPNRERPASVPLDAALQRAVHLHRAVLALRKP